MKAKFFIFEGRPGRINEELQDGFFVCAFEDFETKAITEPFEVFHISEMARSDDDGCKDWLLFSTRKAMQRFHGRDRRGPA